MDTTKQFNTPGGTSVNPLINPPSTEVGPMDSGEGPTLQTQTKTNLIPEPFRSNRGLGRSPERKRSNSPFKFNPEKPQEKMIATSIPQPQNILVSLVENNATNKEIRKSTEQEQMLYNEWQKAINEKNQQSIIILNLQQQIDELKKEIMQVKQQENSMQKTNVKPQSEYCTDEEDLIKETEWIRVKNRKSKKRKLNNTPSPPQKQQAVDQKSYQDVKKIPPPPPIIVEGIKNYHDFYDIVKQSIPEETFTTKLLNENKIKINLQSGDAYKSVVKTLNEGSFIFHTYENKQERPFRVMAKNLHHTCSIQRIKDDLASKKLKVVDVMNKIGWRSKKPLDMFILSFSCDENITRIHEITSILGCKVEIQPLRKSKLIPQCKRCQAYGHTQKYCGKTPRCVKCAGHHLTGECINPKTAQLKCVHCGAAHPASYRGCMVAKEVQRIRNKTMNKPHTTYVQANNNDKLTQKYSEKPAAVPLRNGKITYAQITAGVRSNSEEKQKDASDINQTLQAILMKLTKFDERLQKLEDRSLGARPKSK